MSIKDHMSKKTRRSLYKLLDILPDKTVVRLQYYASLGRFPNLKNPERFTEKLQWYKLNYRTPLMTQCADKYKIRFYLKDKGYEDFSPELYQVCDTFEEIDFDKLPEAFAIKCNNSSGTNIFIKDKSKMNLDEVAEEVRSWKKVKTISAGREWAYENIEQKIVVEELLISHDGTQQDSLNDYKFLCFNGEPKLLWVDMDRTTNHKRAFLDMDWNMLDVTSNRTKTDEFIPKPYGFERMVEVARDISKDFPFVRVDFYSVNEKLYVGELTFYPWSGCVEFTPDSFDFELGSYFTLPPVTKE